MERPAPIPSVAALAPRIGVALLLLVQTVGGSHAQELSGDWPQWRGPLRTGVAPAFEPPATWPEELELLWEQNVGHSNASPVIDGDRLYVFVREGDEEVVRALDLANGETLWEQSTPAPYEPLSIVGEHGAGPFATPLVADGRLYTFGITEILTAWNAQTGERLWQRDYRDAFEKVPAFYGNSVSPLLHDGRLVVLIGGPAGGAILALDPATGDELWRIEGDGPAYGSPVALTLDGVEQLVVFTRKHLVGVDPEAGEELWALPYRVNFDSASVSPVTVGGLLVVGAYRQPTEALRVERNEQGEWQVERAWSNDDVTLQFSSPVLVGERLVGFSVKKKGQLVVLDGTNGALLWEGPPRQGESAFLLAQGGIVLAVTDEGEAVVLEVGDEVREIRRYRVAEKPVWSHPALLDRHLVVKDWGHVRVWGLTPPPPVDDEGEASEGGASEKGGR